MAVQEGRGVLWTSVKLALPLAAVLELKVPLTVRDKADGAEPLEVTVKELPLMARGVP